MTDLRTRIKGTTESSLEIGNFLLKDNGSAIAVRDLTDTFDKDAIASSLALSGVVSPAQITANQNNYSPTGLSSATILRINSDAIRTITGLASGVAGRLLLIANTGNFDIVLASQNASSSVANRFAFSIDYAIAPGRSVSLIYDGTASRWRFLSEPPIVPIDRPSRYFYAYTDFTVASNFVNLANAPGGTGATITPSVTTGPTRAGICNFDAGTTATGRHIVVTNADQIAFGSGTFVYEAAVRIPTLSDGTQSFILLWGFNDSFTGKGVDAVSFHYTHSLYGGNWEAYSRSNSVETTVNTGVAVAINTWYRLRIEINATGTEALFFIDGALVATITTNIPVGTTRASGVVSGIIKTLGTTSRTCLSDYVFAYGEFTSDRV